jgi:hypothetical protein
MAAIKGYDDSPPRNGTIFFYTVLTVFLLILVKILLDSYFAKMMDSEVHDKVLTRGMEEVQAMRATEKEQLEQGSMSIEAAMKQVAQRGRTGIPEVMPKKGEGLAPIEGWREMKRTVAPGPTTLPTLPSAPGTEPAAVTPDTHKTPEPAAQPGQPVQNIPPAH